MFLLFTPFSYLFLTVYLIILFFMLTLSDFYMFWLYIEVAMLLFIGLSYTIFMHSYTQLMLYFLIQTLASFSMLVFYTLGVEFLLYLALFLNLGIFPFMSWYLNVLYRFPSFTLLLSSTLHKLPPLFLFYLFYSSAYSSFILTSVVLSLLVGGFYMLSILDFRYLIVVSSIANNSFLLLGLISGSIFSFSFFFCLYFFTISLVLASLNGLLKPLVYPSYAKQSVLLWTVFLLLNIAAIPPLPMFLAKFIVIFNFMHVMPVSLYILVLLVIANVTMIASYCQLFMKLITQVYSSHSIFLLR